MTLVCTFSACEGETVNYISSNCDSASINYTNHIKTILELNCGSNQNNCHFNGATKANFDFSNYTETKISIQDNVNSLICSIKHEGTCVTMPNKNDSNEKLSDEDIILIEQWICLNYPE